MNHPLDDCQGFIWDEANGEKNWLRHQVTRSECEDVFFNPRLILDDIKHSNTETRYHVLGTTNAKRYLLLAATIRQHDIRIISARDMNKKERTIYEQAIKNNPQI
ncbi:MAG: BrnT family toxin [Ignavibacteriales bacterium]|nr:BrnT family toxin [Ignavibacteriales bacterium]